MTHILAGTAPENKVKKLQKIGLDLSCYHCGAKGSALGEGQGPKVIANRALDGRIYFACMDCNLRIQSGQITI